MSDERMQRLIVGCALAACAALGALMALALSFLGPKLSGGG